MKLWSIISFVCVALFVIGCSRKPASETPKEGEAPAAAAAPSAPSPSTTADAGAKKSPAELIVGTWEYDLKYKSGDVVPCVRIFEKDGTGRQFAVSAGEAGAQRFKWEIVQDGNAVSLAYGAEPLMTLVYTIERLDDDLLVMIPPTDEAKEECKRRVAPSP